MAIWNETLVLMDPLLGTNQLALPKTVSGKPADKDSVQSKLREALDRKIIPFESKYQVIEIVDVLMKKADLKIHVKYPETFNPNSFKNTPTLAIKSVEMTLGAWLQLVTDEVADDSLKNALPVESGKRYDFYVRDYGLHLATKETAAPGAMPLSEFWKQPLPAARSTPATNPMSPASPKP